MIMELIAQLILIIFFLTATALISERKKKPDPCLED